jgi:hypothetical protein
VVDHMQCCEHCQVTEFGLHMYVLLSVLGSPPASTQCGTAITIVWHVTYLCMQLLDAQSNIESLSRDLIEAEAQANAAASLRQRVLELEGVVNTVSQVRQESQPNPRLKCGTHR